MTVYLSVADLCRLNTFQIEYYSPGEHIGVKDLSALEMIVKQPSQYVFGKELYPTIEEKAAILIINIIKKHPFHNANKRTGSMALDIFLDFNGYTLTINPREYTHLAVYIATYKGEFDSLKDEVSKIIKDNLESTT